jgi:hypothetical protein
VRHHRSRSPAPPTAPRHPRPTLLLAHLSLVRATASGRWHWRRRHLEKTKQVFNRWPLLSAVASPTLSPVPTVLLSAPPSATSASTSGSSTRRSSTGGTSRKASTSSAVLSVPSASGLPRVSTAIAVTSARQSAQLLQPTHLPLRCSGTCLPTSFLPPFVKLAQPICERVVSTGRPHPQQRLPPFRLQLPTSPPPTTDSFAHPLRLCLALRSLVSQHPPQQSPHLRSPPPVIIAFRRLPSTTHPLL